MSSRKAANWATIYGRSRGSEAPKGDFAPPRPDPVPKDSEAEVERLADARREREERLRAILDAE